jgi:hypothetical protein
MPTSYACSLLRVHAQPARFSACMHNMRSCFHILSPTVYPKKYLNIGHSRRMSFLSFHLSSALQCNRHRSHRVLYACRQKDQVSSRDMSICIPLPWASCPEFSLLGIMSDGVTQQAYYQALGEGDRQKEVRLPDPVHQSDRRHQHHLDH